MFRADDGVVAADVTMTDLVNAIKGGALAEPVNRLPLAQRYDYVFDGDSETLSGLLVSPALNCLVASEIPVHINADFAGQTSDHDPLLAYINPPR